MSDFWNRVLGGNGPPATVAAPPTTVYPNLPAAHTWTPGQPLHQPAPEATTHPKAPSSMSTLHCPECGSGNYTGVPGDRTKMIRCYDCGYNPRFGAQSGAVGIPSGQGGAAAHPSRQVSTENNYNPQHVIGRIDG